MNRGRDRRRDFKKGISKEESRRKREETSVRLRKEQRFADMMVKRRMRAPGQATEGGDASSQAPLTGNLDLQQFRELVKGCKSNNPKLQLECVQQFRRVLSMERNPPIQDVINSGVVPFFVRMLTDHSNPSLQFEAAWALTNVASGTTLHTRAVIDNGAVEVLVGLLTSTSEDVREQAVWALGNIAGDSSEFRNRVLRAGALPHVIALCNTTSRSTLLRNATWTLSNLCRGKPQPDFSVVRVALPKLCQLLFAQDDEVLTDALWALSYLSDDSGTNNEKIQAVLQSGCARRVVELLLHASPGVRTPALRSIGNIVTGDDLQTQVIINAGALQCLAQLLKSKRKTTRKEACWTISNITAGNPQQISAVINANIIPLLIKVMQTEDFDVRKEAAWAVSNATTGGRAEHIRHLVSQGAIPPLCELFKCPDTKLVNVALEGIDNILKIGQEDAAKHNGVNKFAEYVEECGGLDQLEQLQDHEDDGVYEKAVKLLQDFFDGEEQDEDAAIKPTVNTQNQFAFGAQKAPGAPPGGFSFQ